MWTSSKVFSHFNQNVAKWERKEQHLPDTCVQTATKPRETLASNRQEGASFSPLFSNCFAYFTFAGFPFTLRLSHFSYT